MTPPQEIEQLVERFDRNKDQYTSGNYNEAQLRREFVDPMFTLLGWDIDNRQGFAEPYKEVIHEDTIKIGSATKAPDYSFRVGGSRKFFVEAKKPAINVKEDVEPAYQLRRYAWSAKLPLSILTDFEEFAVYDCRLKPLKIDKSSTARIQYLTYADYIPKWDLISSVFSKEAVLRGSFDKFAETARGKKGTAEVDDAFLKEIESWRESLAKNIALRNSRLSQRELNFAVQRTIDRLIFLRICEDRGIEIYGKLLGLTNGANLYRRLVEDFYKADEKYNSGLFHFTQERDRGEGPDELTPKLHIDDKPLVEIIKNLYYPDCPYEFSVLPADILGQVYEQFLGKVIRLTTGHQAKVEDKPEVKKAGGVYYTPTYIVDYIVKNTVGRLVEEKTPRQVSTLRILDPACGSGSFLIGAYQYLLHWHRDWYVKDGAEKHTSGKNAALYKGPGDDWRLTTGERKRILLNNIYGVDIDSQAVEVTKLSLLLKVLEGESEQTINQQLKMFHERALPDLANNIKCGNSLIGPDFYEGKQLSLLDDEEKNRINVFDWKKEFKEINDEGGFHAVIGNPPWISAWTGEERVREYLTRNLQQLSGHWDMYVAFLLSTIRLVNSNGEHAFLYPTSILTEPYAKDVREMLIDRGILNRLATFGSERIFLKVSRKVCILVLRLKPVSNKTNVDIWEAGRIIKARSINANIWKNNHNCMIDVESSDEDASIRKKIDLASERVGNYYYVNYGAQISSKVKGAFKQDRLLGMKRIGNSKKCLNGSSVKRYAISWDGIYLDYKPEIMYGPRVPEFFESNKIIVNKTSSKGYGLMASFDSDKFYCDQRLVCAVKYSHLSKARLKSNFEGYEPHETDESELYHTGLLNSRLLSFFFATYIATKNLQGQYTDVVPKMVRSLPLRRIDFLKAPDKTRHDRMVEMVKEMLELHKKLPKAKTEQEKTVIQRQIDATDKQIDQLVYELYDLSEEEIKIVEGNRL